MVGQIDELKRTAEVIVVNNKESEYIEALSGWGSDQVVVDMVRLPEHIRKQENYIGINW